MHNRPIGSSASLTQRVHATVGPMRARKTGTGPSFPASPRLGAGETGPWRAEPPPAAGAIGTHATNSHRTSAPSAPINSCLIGAVEFLEHTDGAARRLYR